MKLGPKESDLFEGQEVKFKTTNDADELLANMTWNEATNELCPLAGTLSYVILNISFGINAGFSVFITVFIKLKSFDVESKFW